MNTEIIEKQKEYIEKVKKINDNKNKKYYILTMGCQLNENDSEKLIGIMEEMGYSKSEDIKNADLYVINTCCVRENAEEKLFGKLGELKKIKENKNIIIAIGGCMMQEEHITEKIKKSYPFVDIVFGTHTLHKFPEDLYIAITKNKKVKDVIDIDGEIYEGLPVKRSSNKQASVIIMYGCNNFCTYCIVPYVRGRERSRNPKDIIREIEQLVSEGVVEVMLLGQNVNSYGKTLEEPMTFAELLREVEKIEGLQRIRFMTSHPKDLSDDLIQVMKESKKICRHLHLPLQAGSSRILQAMNRRYTKEQYLALAKKIRQEIPDISLTTDLIVGFPGETAADVDETIEVVKEVQYDNAFTFIYSKRTGTPAAAMENPVSEQEIKDNFDRLLKVVQDTARERVGRLQGQTMEALVEEVNEQDASLLTGRLSNNTIVHFPGDSSLIGSIVKVNLKECHGFYYIGEMVI